MPAYEYADPDTLEETPDIEAAIRATMLNYMHHQLGVDLESCQRRTEKELEREIPKSLFETMEESRGWDLKTADLLDVGSGQGAGVLEALIRGADAHGVEPGQEFAELSRLRLKENSFAPKRIHETEGQNLPFPDCSFDYVISLQVLEHVEDPEPILREIYRVLRPGGECHIRCENYLAFREKHYRVPWFPLLPKSIGGMYLSLLGRDPTFLSEYIFYTTYPQIWQLAAKIGFENRTYDDRLRKVEELSEIESPSSRMIGRLIRFLPEEIRRRVVLWGTHLANAFRVGVTVHLRKPV